MKKKKAFTLIELLAVIVLIVMIMLIFTPDILKLINNSQSNTYSVKEKLVARAGEDYSVLSRISLPSLTGEEKLIDIETLISNNFMTPIYDFKDNERCLGYLVIEKNPTYGHNYKTCLFCSDYQTQDSDCHTDRLNTIGMEVPVLLMYNNTPYYTELGDAYTDPGCVAYDSDGTNITDRIVITGLPINTSTIGINTVTYSVTNAGGVSATPVSRQVVVRDTTAPVVVFGTNGNTTPQKDQSTTVTVTDFSGLSDLRYYWSSSSSAPDDVLFTQTFTSGQTIASSSSLNGTYYLWIYAMDNNSNLTKIRTKAFKFDNEAPSIASATIVSNNTLNNKQIKNGETAILSLVFSEIIGNEPTVTIGGRTAVITGTGLSRTAAYTIPANESSITEGTLQINISNYEDEAGNVGSTSSSITSGGTVNYDRTPPAYTYFYIGGSGNPASINNVNTVLSSSVSGATHMCINTVSGECTLWEPYGATKEYTLSSGSGIKTVYVWYRDQANNQAGPYQDSITMDVGKPSIASTSVVSNNALNNKQAKNGDTVTLSITFSENISNTPSVTIGGRTASISGSGTTRTATYTIPAGESSLAEGSLPIYISNYQDEAGNTGDPSSTITSGGAVNYDRTSPTYTYFYIGGSGNPASINNVNTTLSSSTSGVAQMCVSTTTSCSSWQTYSSSTSYTLASGEGTKTLYVWYRDAAGNTIGYYSDTVSYDITDPSVASATIVSSNGSSNKIAKNGDTVTLSISFTESISNTPSITIGGRSAIISGSGTTRTATYTIPAGEASMAEGDLAINISSYNDVAGNTGLITTTTTSGGYVNYDRTAPSIGYFYIGGTGNPVTTTSLSTTLYFSVSGATQMCISTTTSCSAWETYASSKAYTLSGSYGTKTLYAWFKDTAGNVSNTSDQISYVQGAHTDTYTCGVSGYSSDEMGWSVSTSTVIQGSAAYTNYYGVMYFRNSSTLKSAFQEIRESSTNYDITSVEVKILSHVAYARTVRLYVGGPCPTPDYSNNGISGANPTMIGGSTNYVEDSVAANGWATFTITNSTWINALLNANSACLFINRGDSSASYWEGDGAKDTNKPTFKITYSPK